MQPPGRLEEQAPVGRHGRLAPPRRWASADRSAPGGWVPCIGWSSCCGSPSSTRLSVARETATTLASEIWPASSTNRTSTAPTIFADAHSQGVPAARLARPSSSRARTSLASLPRVDPLVVEDLLLLALLDGPDSRPGLLLGRLEDRLEQVADDLVARPGDADALAGREQGQDHAGAGVGLAGPRRALDRERRPIERQGQPAGGRRGRVSPARQRPRRRLADPRRAPQEQVARRAERTVGIDAVGRRPSRRSRRATPGSSLRPDPVERHDRARMGLVERAAGCRPSRPPRRRPLVADRPARTDCRSAAPASARGRRPRRGRGRSPAAGTVAPRSACRSSARRAARRARARRSGRALDELLRVRSIRRWKSHHIDLSSRRCQPRSWRGASGVLLGRAIGRVGRDDVGPASRSTRAWTRACASVRSAGSSSTRGTGRGTGWPVSACQLVAAVLQPVAEPRLHTTSSRL